MADPRRPSDTDVHRRQRGKNLFVAGFLVVMALMFFFLTIVRMGGQG
ncbi:hypothetical protein [Reyranella sp.]